MNEIKVIGLNGSVRRGSYNRLLLKNLANIMSKKSNNIEMKILEVKDIPIYNPDEEYNLPKIVVEYKNIIRESDAIIIATPEYNFSFPGVLKNALDWFTRPPSDNVLKYKISGILSASTGMLGGARAQYQLRQVLLSSEMDVISKPEIFLSFADKKFDSEGNLKDEVAIKLLDDFVSNLIRKINKN